MDQCRWTQELPGRRGLHRSDRGLCQWTYHLFFPGDLRGPEVTGIQLEFENGKVVNASRGEDLAPSSSTSMTARAFLASSLLARISTSRNSPSKSCSTRRSAAPFTLAVGEAYAGPAEPTPPLSTGTWSATCATAGASKSTGRPSWSTANTSFSAGRMMTLIHLSLPPQSQLSFRPKWRNLLPRQPNPQRRPTSTHAPLTPFSIFRDAS